MTTIDNCKKALTVILLAFCVAIMLPACSSTEETTGSGGSGGGADEGPRCITGDGRCDKDCTVFDGDCARQ